MRVLQVFRPITPSVVRFFKAEGKKKAQVEKALIALFQKMNSHEVNAEVCALLLRFSQVCEVAGGHEGKEIIRKLTDQHWDHYKQFKDIKFMNK